MIETPSPTACPRCRSAVTTTGNAEPWCPECGWNLDRYEPDRRPPASGVRWLDRLTYRMAYRMTTRQYRILAGGNVSRGRWGVATVVLLAAGVLLLIGVPAMVVGGGYLIVADFPSRTIVPGTLCVLIGLAVRPRVARLDRLQRPLDRSAAPTLFALVDQVAAAIGAPAPHRITVNRLFNARATVVGLRRRRVLCLGLPLWGVLPPQQRVALIGHELGHFVNGDVRRGALTGLPMTTFGTLAGLFRSPARLRPPAPPGRVRSRSIGELVGEAISRVVFRAVRFLALCVHFLFLWLGMRDSQRAEYLADELAARAAGSAAVIGTMDTLCLADWLFTLVKREARQGNGAARWRAAADEARFEAGSRLPLLRQLSIRDETSLLATHPPAGLRIQMLESRPAPSAAVVLTEHDSARIDEELAKAYEAVRRDLALI